MPGYRGMSVKVREIVKANRMQDSPVPICFMTMHSNGKLENVKEIEWVF